MSPAQRTEEPTPRGRDAQLAARQVRRGAASSARRGLNVAFTALQPRSIVTWLALGLLAGLAAGCAHLPGRPVEERSVIDLPADTAAYYQYPGELPVDTRERLEERGSYERWLVRFQMRRTDFEPTEPTVEIEWFQVKGPGRRAALLFSPILGGDYPLERGIARYFARNGYHVALVHRKTLKVAPEKDVAHLELLLRQAIVRNRQIVDWLSAQPQVDPSRLGSFGISMGGMANVITAAVEPRLQRHVVALAGGSLANILRDSKDKLLTKPRTRYLAHHQIDVETMHRLLTEGLRTDPLRMAPYVRPDRMLMIVALGDRTIGRRNALQLWRALGRPEALFIPLGHYTTYLYLPYVKYQSLRYFRKHLPNAPTS